MSARVGQGWRFFCLGGLGLLAGCQSEPQQPAPEPIQEARVVSPPPGKLRAIPPYAVTARGIGPLRLGMSVRKASEELVTPPSVQVVDVPGLLESTVFAAESNQLLVGSEEGSRVTFVASLSKAMTKFDETLMVGDEIKEGTFATSTTDNEQLRCQDRGEVCAVVLKKKIAAFVVREPRGQLSHKGDWKIETTENSVRLISKKKVVTVKKPDDYVACAFHLIEKSPYLFVVRKREFADKDVYSVETWQIMGAKAVRSGSWPVYTVRNDALRWIGRTKKEVQLLLEVYVQGRNVEIGGLVVSALGTPQALIVPLVWRSYPLRKRTGSPGRSSK